MKRIKLLDYFIKTVHPKLYEDIINLGQETLVEVINGFNEYINKLDPKIIDKCELDIMKVISNKDNPLKVKGWSPVLVIHFDQYINEELNKK